MFAQTEISIRPATAGDLAAMTELLAVLFSIEADFTVDERNQRHGLEMMIENPRGQILVAVVDGKIAGMCSGQLTVSTAEGGYAVLVEDLVVHRDRRNLGIGEALMCGIGSWATERGATRLQLLADRNNGPALSFYSKLGWNTTKLICLRKRES